MFNVGANNPNVGNDRRKGLIDQLAQQLAQRFAQQMSQGHAAGPDFSASDGAHPFIDLQRRRQQNPAALAAAGAPSRVAGQGRATAGTPLIAMPLGGGHSAAMRPAMVPGRLSGHLSPTPGVAVPHAPGGPANPLAPFTPARPAVGTSLTTPNGQTYVNDNAGPNNLTFPSGPSANPAAPQAAMGAADTTAMPDNVHGWISVGNGIFYNPVTGTVRGPSAGISNGLTGIDGKF